MYKKIIGTFTPLSSLYTSHTKQLSAGTIYDGIIFLHWLKKTGQNAWQMLPLHETQFKTGSKVEHAASPYKGYGIGLDPKYATKNKEKMEHGKWKMENFNAWLPDYSLFCALRDHFGTDNWTLWDMDIRLRKMHALEDWKEKLAKEIMLHSSQQLQLHEEFTILRQTAKERAIALIGDLPLYLPLQSPLVWKYQHVFRISEDGALPRVSGVANEEKATYGRQIWGHPLYRWDIPALHQDIIELFQLRLHYLSELFDIIRLDHANGFFLYGSIDPINEHNDKNLNGPGFAVFKQLVQFCRENNLQIFAEDAAVTLKKLREAMKTLSIPGIYIFRYAYDEKKDFFEPYYIQPSTYVPQNFAYTTTHDTETLMGFLALLNASQKKKLAQITNIQYHSNDKQFAINIRTSIMNSPAHTIIPIQDWLLEKKRINVPGTETEHNDPNWKYRLPLPIEELPSTF